MEPWIAVDLDGTLAYYDDWDGAENIGEPIPAMLERVRRWIAIGKTVRIFTARACIPEQIPFVRKWLDDLGLESVGITNQKDFGMTELWDDRCIRVERNTGRPLQI